MGKKRLALHLAAFWVIALFAFWAISSGSVTLPTIIFDESVPPERSVKLYFAEWIQVTSYNGIPIKTKPASKTGQFSGLGMLSEWHYVYVMIPAGESEIVFSTADNRRSTEHRGVVEYHFRDITFTYTFEPGEYYYITFGPFNKGDEGWEEAEKVDKGTEWGIQIWKGGLKGEVVATLIITGSGEGGGKEGGIILE
jgi:hypothetical protein